MTTYLGEKAVGIGTIKATKAVAGDVLHDETLVGNGNTEPLGVDKQVIATTNQVANLSVTLHAAIEAQAEAIAKTRNDFEIADQNIRADMNAEDSRLQTQITSQASQITTNKNDIDELGDDVAEIQAKIPESASGNNPLITKADLKDVGGDFIKKSGDAMTGILTIQAEEDYDPSTPPVGGLSFKSNASPDGFTNRMRQVANGFIAIEYLLNGKQYSNLVFSDQEIYIDNTENGTGNPVSLGTSGNPWDNVYAKKLNNGADVVIPTEGGTLARKEDLIDLRADINEADSELQTQITAQAGAIAKKVDATGDTMTGTLSVPELNVATSEGTLNLSITAGVATIATNNGLDIVSQTKFDKAPTTDDNTTYANALDVSLMRKAQVATAISDALDNVDALPDQTGNAGKFLTTDGTEASWSDKPLVNTAEGVASICVGGNGAYTKGLFATAVGTNSLCDVNGGFGVAIGYSAQVRGNRAIQIGSGENGDANTLKVSNANGNFEMMSADGTIPADRMSTTAGTTGQVLTKTDTGMGWSDVSPTRIIFREWE